jgi:hypothetical protein
MSDQPGTICATLSTKTVIIQIAEGRRLEVLLYFRDACDRLMTEKGWTVLEDLPWLVAKEAKKRGLSNTVDLTYCILVAKADPVVDELLIRTGGKLPEREKIGCFLAHSISCELDRIRTIRNQIGVSTHIIRFNPGQSRKVAAEKLLRSLLQTTHVSSDGKG